ncbi:hypothetical protein L0Y46_00045 [bacterium]|nr:hypothetical protein [bacterium]
MGDNYTEKKERAFLRLAAEFISIESSGASLVTATRCVLSNHGKEGTVFFSVIPDHKEAAALDFLRRKRSEFRIYVKSHIKTDSLPRFDFAIDLGEKNRQKMDKLLAKK